MSATRGIDAKTVHAWDGFVLFWVVLWIVLGAWTGVTLWQAAEAGDTISSSGQALVTAGGGLQSLSDIPVIGERPGQIGDEVVTTGGQITERGQLVKGQLHRLAVLLGIVVVFVPVMPVAGFYLPLRLRWRGQVRELASGLEKHGDEPAFDAYLADRARSHLPYPEVARLTSGTAEETDRRLADAELARVGLDRPAQG